MFNSQTFNSVFALEITSPLSQFEIRDLLSLDAPILGNLHLSITNIGLFLVIGAFFLLVINLLSTNYNKLVGNGLY
jgi:F-type H+-transporting ATPase subunit a